MEVGQSLPQGRGSHLAAFPSNAGPGPQKHEVGGAGRGPTHSPQLAGVAPPSPTTLARDEGTFHDDSNRSAE